MGLVKGALLLGAGYVAGTAAGRERYEQIKHHAITALKRPEVRSALQRARATTTGALTGALHQARASWHDSAPTTTPTPAPTQVTAGARPEMVVLPDTSAHQPPTLTRTAPAEAGGPARPDTRST